MAETISRRSIVYDILFEVQSGKKSAKEAEKSLQDIGKTANKVDETIKTLGKSFVAAFAAEKIISFVKEASELADKAQAVRIGFEKLNGVSLAKLREATGGAVDDLVLMQKAVQASNFKVPLDQLEKLFRFATKRAKETGESVDVLVDSIVEGLGGGSARAFKALGISSDEFARKIKLTGNATKAVGAIIDETFKKTGDSIEGLVDAGDRLSSSMTNFQLAIGSLINDGFLDDFKDFLGDVIQLTTDLITGQNSYNDALEETKKVVQLSREEQINLLATTLAAQDIGFKSYTNGATLTQEEQLKIIDNYRKEAEAIFAVNEEIGGQIDAILDLKKVLKFQVGDVADEGAFGEPVRNIKFLEKEIASIQNLITELPPDTEDTVVNMWTEQIKLLQLELEVLRYKFGLVKSEVSATSDEISKFNKDGKAITKIGDDTGALASVFSKELSQAVESSAQALSNLASLAADGSKAQIALSIANVLAANAEALANGVASAMRLPPPANIAAALGVVATITGIFAQIKAISAQAQAASSSASQTASAFAEGEVDIHRKGETRGKDSIPAIIMPGETVTTTEMTSRYKPFLEAIHNGNLEDLIRVNYVDPAIAAKALGDADKDSRVPDYSDRFYRQYLATGEGNVNGKRMVRILSSIDRKLTAKPTKYSH